MRIGERERGKSNVKRGLPRHAWRLILRADANGRTALVEKKAQCAVEALLYLDVSALGLTDVRYVVEMSRRNVFLLRDIHNKEARPLSGRYSSDEDTGTDEKSISCQ